MVRFYLIISLLFFSSIGESQILIDSLMHHRRGIEHRASFCSSVGINILNNNLSFNKFLETENYRPIHNLKFDINYIELEAQYKNYLAKVGFGCLSSMFTTNLDNGYSKISGGNVSVYFGYEIFENHKWSIYPMIGFIDNRIKVKLTSSGNNQKDLFDSEYKVILNPEFCIRYNALNTISYGINIGYKKDMMNDSWDKKLINSSTSLNLSGFMINLCIQYNFIDL